MVKRKKADYKGTTVTIRLPKYLKDQVKLSAQAEGRKVSSFVKAAIKAKLDRDDPQQ